MTDEERERAIADQCRKLEEAFDRGDIEQARVCSETMNMLITGRSTRAVEAMEWDRGLRT